MDSDTLRGQGEADAYWRRRVYVLAGGIAVIGLMAWACSGSGDKKSTAQVRNAAGVISPTPAAAVPASAVPTATVTVTVTPTAPVPAGRHGGDTCDQRDVVVGLTTEKDTYPAGERPRFRVTVVNTGERACTVDVGARALRLRISSGPDRLWSSDRCSGGPASDLQLLNRGVPYIAELTWDRRRCDGESRAQPGTYVIAAKGEGVRTQRQVFRLR